MDDEKREIDVADDEAWQKFLAEDGEELSDDTEADGEADPAPERENEDALDIPPLTADAPEGDAPPVEAGPEPAKQPERAAEDTHPAKQTVPLHDLLSEREKRKALERRLEALEAASAPKQEPATIPDPLTDPDGYREYDQRRFDAMQQEQQVSALRHSYAVDKLEAFQTVEGYQDQYHRLVESRQAELQRQHPGATPEQIQQQIQLDEMHVAMQAQQMGVRPHQLVRQMMEQREAQARAWAEANGYQRPADPAPAAAPAIPADEARRRNRSLASASGTKEPSVPIEQIAAYDAQGELSDKEWEEKMRRAGMM